MAFQQGTYTTIHDLLDKFRIFAVAQGWTQSFWSAGSGTVSNSVVYYQQDANDSRLYLTKGLGYFTMVGRVYESATRTYHATSQAIELPVLHTFPSTSFNTSNDYNDQPGNPQDGIGVPNSLSASKTEWLFPNGVQYYFFSNGSGDYVHAVVETIPGEFMHFGVGALEKAGTWTGGEYSMNTLWNQAATNIDAAFSDDHSVPWDTRAFDSGFYCHLRCDTLQASRTDGFTATPWFFFLNQNQVGSVYGENRLNGLHTGVLEQVNDFNQSVPLWPVYIRAQQASSLTSILGTVSDVRVIWMENITPGDTITLGSDDWLVFPVQTKKDPGTADNLPNSSYWGVAYKKIP